MRLVIWAGNVALLIAGLAALLSSKAVRHFVDRHGTVMYVVALVLLVALLVITEQWWTVRSRHPAITDRDQELFNRLEQEFSPDTQAMTYLREFNGKACSTIPGWKPPCESFIAPPLDSTVTRRARASERTTPTCATDTPG
jgi:hypothetical protein